MRFKADIRGWRFVFLTTQGNVSFRAIKKPSIPVVGITSKCYDGMHIFIGECDGVRKDVLVDYLNMGIQRFKMSHVYLFRSSKGELDHGVEKANWHFYELGKRTVGENCRMLDFFPIDPNYGHSWEYNAYKDKVLRTSPKGAKGRPEFVEVIRSPYDNNVVSTAHKEVLEKYYNVPKLKYKREDNINAVTKCRYLTAHA